MEGDVDNYYRCNQYLLIYLFINCNTITNYILSIYELSNFDHVLGVMSQTRVWCDAHASSLEHYSQDYRFTQMQPIIFHIYLIFNILKYKFIHIQTREWFALLTRLLKERYVIGNLADSLSSNQHNTSCNEKQTASVFG